MRIYHFSLIFAVFALMMLSAAAVSMEGTEEDEMSRACLDLVLDRASESAAAVLTKAHASGVYGQRDLAVETFFGALSAGLGLADGTPAMTMLRLYVPKFSIMALSRQLPLRDMLCMMPFSLSMV